MGHILGRKDLASDQRFHWSRSMDKSDSEGFAAYVEGCRCIGSDW